MTELRYLAGTVDLPFATIDQRLVTQHGYDEGVSIYLARPRDSTLSVPIRPTADQVKRAACRLLQPWKAYAFAGPNDAAGMASAVLAALSRMVLGLCPAYLMDASSPGSGKTKAATALGALIEGRRPAVTPFAGTTTDDELRKRFTAGAVDGARFACIDNVVGHLKSPVLAAVLTTGRISDRVLGQSKTVEVNVRSLVTLTANNASLMSDLQRRTVAVRIDGGHEPTRRVFDFCPVNEALANRWEIAEAACVIWRAYFNAGAPEIVAGDAGGFADWNRLCRQPVLWLAREGFAELLPWPLGDLAARMLADASTSDPDLEALGDLLRGMFALTDGGSGDFESKDVLTVFRGARLDDPCDPAALVRSALVEICGLRRDDEPSARSIGRVLMNRRDRAVSGLALRARTDCGTNARRWRVARL